MAFTVNQAFRILREHGVTEMKVGLAENEISEGPADRWTYYSYKKHFYFFVDADGNVVGGRKSFDEKLILLRPKKGKGALAGSGSCVCSPDRADEVVPAQISTPPGRLPKDDPVREI